MAPWQPQVARENVFPDDWRLSSLFAICFTCVWLCDCSYTDLCCIHLQMGNITKIPGHWKDFQAPLIPIRPPEKDRSMEAPPSNPTASKGFVPDFLVPNNPKHSVWFWVHSHAIQQYSALLAKLIAAKTKEACENKSDEHLFETFVAGKWEDNL